MRVGRVRCLRGSSLVEEGGVSTCWEGVRRKGGDSVYSFGILAALRRMDTQEEPAA